MRRNWIKVALVMVLTVAVLAGCSSGGSGDEVSNTVVVGSKNYTENLLCGEIVAQLLEEKTDLDIERQFNLGSAVVFEGVKKGEIDIFCEYTGTGLINVLEMDPIEDKDETYRTVKEEYKERFDLIWLEQWGFNNSYANAVTREFSETNGVTKNSELAPLTPELIYGGGHVFFDRVDGYENMCKHYGFDFKEEAKMDVNLVYQAIGQNRMDVASVFTTDSMLAVYDLVVLEDDLDFFPAYYCAPVIRGEVLEAHPEIGELLSQIEESVTDADMIRYNYLVDSQEKTLEQTARQFLEDRGLI